MKKSILILITAVGLFAYQVFGQTISVSGTSGTINPTSGSTSTITLTLQIVGNNSIGNVESVNGILQTFAAGLGLSGAGKFSTTVTPSGAFTLANNTSSSTFNTMGDGNQHAGATVSDPSLDRGSNAPAGSAPAVNSTGTTTITFETISFKSLSALTPGTVYNFAWSAGGFADASQGSYINNTAAEGSMHFDITSEPTFTITVVPEPATWSLFGLGALGALGLNLRRVRRKA